MSLPEGYTQQEYDQLTQVEKESIGVEIDDKGPVVKVEAGSAEEKAAEAAKDAANAKLATDAKAAAEAKVAADAKTAADAKVAADAKAVADAKAAVPPAEESADAIQDAKDPRPLIPTLKADKLVSDEEHATSQSALAKRFEDGEITTPQFIIENERLTRAKLESDLAVRSASQNDELTWQARQDAFFSTSGNEIIRDDPRVWAAMQAQLETMYSDPKCKDYSDMQFLNEAGREVRRLFGIDQAAHAQVAAKKKDKKPAGTAVDVPVTLADAPAAAENLDGGGEFTYMDKLDGMEYELAIAKMTNEQKARFLAI